MSIDPDNREWLEKVSKTAEALRASVLRLTVGPTVSVQRINDTPLPRVAAPILTPHDRRLAEVVARVHFGAAEGGLEVVKDEPQIYELRPATAVRRV